MSERAKCNRFFSFDASGTGEHGTFPTAGFAAFPGLCTTGMEKPGMPRLNCTCLPPRVYRGDTASLKKNKLGCVLSKQTGTCSRLA